MAQKFSLVFLIFFMLSINTAAQQVYPYLTIEVDTYKLEAYPKGSVERYEAILELVNDVEQQRDTKIPYNIHKMSETYISLIKEVQGDAIEYKKWDDYTLLNNHEFDHYLHYKPRAEGVLLATEFLNDTLQIKNSFRMQLYSYLSTVYQDLGLNKEFIDLIPKMYALKKEMNRSDIALSSQDAAVGDSYYLNKNYDIAIQYYYKALAVAKEEKNKKLTVQILNDLGQSYKRLSKKDSAVAHYDRAISILQHNTTLSKNKKDTYLVYFLNKVNTHKAELLYADSAPEKVIPYALQTFLTFPNEVNPVELVSIFNLLGKLYYVIGDYLQAEAYLLMAREKLILGVHPEDHIINIRTEALVALGKGEKKRSISLFRKQERFEDSITLLKTNTRMAIALSAYNTKEKEVAIKEQELRIATQENELKNQRQQRLLYFVLIGGFLIVGVLGSFYIRRIRKQRKQITAQKVALDESLQQKEILLKEVHHRVKNNLQIVSSLLEGQADKTDDATVKSIMTEGQDRINAMALIHQQLYRSEDFKNICLKNYVKNLFDHLYISQNKQGVHIKQILDINVVPIDIDVAVPFGIILNELISNCYKYAFKNRSKGVINVSITSVSDTHNELIVADDGVGLPKDFDSKKSHSLGMKLIEGIAWQLRGKLTYTYTEKGSTFKVLFIKNLATIQKNE